MSMVYGLGYGARVWGLGSRAPLPSQGSRVGRGGAWGAKNQRPGLGREALQSFGGAKTCKTDPRQHGEFSLQPIN